MENKILVIKITLTTACAFFGDKFGALCPTLCLFMLLMLVDYVSGMLAAKKEALEHPNDNKYGWSSKKGVIGIYKKVGYIITVLVAISTDYVIFKMVDEIGLEYNTNTLFGLMVLVWFVLNELLSILENAERMGVQLPFFLVSALSNIRKNIEEEE